MSDNMKVWNALKTPPPAALKKIEGGRLKGMTDISPQWRYKAMTEEFGPCGIGWKYEVVRTWQEAGSEDQVFAFAEIKLFVSLSLPIEKVNPDTAYVTWEPAWSEPIPGIGGSMLIAKEKAGLHSSDEAYKMAITDALSVAMKMIGVGADVYMGMVDGKHTPPAGKPADKPKDKPADDPSEKLALVIKIGNICMEIAEGDEAQAGGVLYDLTQWVDDEGKVKRQGTRKGNDLKKYTEAALKTVYGKAKAAKATWEKAHGEPVEKPSEDDSDVPF